MTRGRSGLVASAAALAVGALVLGTAPSSLGTATTGAPASSRASALGSGAPITHVVIIYQENHAFDDVLGELCQTRDEPCNGYTGPVTFADGKTAKNIVEPDIVPESEHTPRAAQHGLANEWDKIGACTTPPYRCVTHVDPRNIPNLAALADEFVVSDATFESGDASSFGAHVTLGGGTLDGFSGRNPVPSKTGARPRAGWGCPSRHDVLWGKSPHQTFEPSCIPDPRGNGPYRPSKVPYTPTIMERMEEAGLSWHIYEGDTNDKPLVGPWSICTYFAWCLHHRFETRYDSKRPDFVTAAAAGTLPNLSILLPTGSTPIGGVSQHNGNSMRLGDNYIGQMVEAVENGPEWDSTAIFVTYDDCGCFYDHVKPPKGLGLRNPMVIISPYAKPGFTDSHVAVQPYSMLAFTEHLFDLHSLSKEVSHAYDYRDSFDFSQRPLAGPAMTMQPISTREQRRLAMLAPEAENDPT